MVKDEAILKEALKLVYEKGQEEGASLTQLLQDAGKLLIPLINENK